ncbi:MAG: hypothetical protein PHH00_00850 [Candidatus Nanoarchaeia archaeon]|nr:hypothetical protein [Candidatus Nanoarchaeia archaeon]
MDTDGQDKNKMKKKKLLNGFLLIGIFFLALQSISLVSAYCAEYTNWAGGGAWCQDVTQSECDSAYRCKAIACESTDYCSTGTCVNTITGTCFSSPQATCNPSNNGTWYITLPSSTPTCSMGCCLVGDQASFTTSAGCDILSGRAGISPNFDKTVTSNSACTALARPQEKGACVYDTSSGRTCQFITRESCTEMTSYATTFYEGFLCTNPTLGTNCKPTEDTSCFEGSDQVFFVDTCGEQANVYDANNTVGINPNYWNYAAGTVTGLENGVTVPPGDNLGNIGSATSGNCNYYLGSTCMAYNRNIDPVAPAKGDNICRNVNCVSGTFSDLFNALYSRAPYNGETWCGKATNTGVQLTSGNPGINSADFLSYDKTGNNPGDTEIVFSCANGRITTEANAAYRSKVCVQDTDENGYISGGFVVNKWQDCYYQNSSVSCLNNTEVRDCKWVTGASILKDSATGQPLVYDEGQDSLVISTGKDDTRPEAACVPKYPPGFDISASGGATDISSSTICGLASRTCVVNYSAGIFGNWIVGATLDRGPIVCLNDDEELVEDWASNMENMCRSLGDCGVSVNYVGKDGSNVRTNLFNVVRGNMSGTSIQ